MTADLINKTILDFTVEQVKEVVISDKFNHIHVVAESGYSPKLTDYVSRLEDEYRVLNYELHVCSGVHYLGDHGLSLRKIKINPNNWRKLIDHREYDLDKYVPKMMEFYKNRKTFYGKFPVDAIYHDCDHTDIIFTDDHVVQSKYFHYGNNTVTLSIHRNEPIFISYIGSQEYGVIPRLYHEFHVTKDGINWYRIFNTYMDTGVNPELDILFSILNIKPFKN